VASTTDPAVASALAWTDARQILCLLSVAASFVLCLKRNSFAIPCPFLSRVSTYDSSNNLALPFWACRNSKCHFQIS
jgi:hypothetical protein